MYKTHYFMLRAEYQQLKVAYEDAKWVIAEYKKIVKNLRAPWYVKLFNSFKGAVNE